MVTSTLRRGRGRPRKEPAPSTPEAHPEDAGRPEPMTSTELSKTVKAMERAARQAGAILQKALSDDPAGQWKIAHLLKQEFGESTAQIAALMVLHAMAQTPASMTISPDSLTGQWRTELEEGNPDQFKPITSLAAEIMETVNGADPYTANEMTHVLQDTAERIRDTLPGNDLTGTAMQKLMSNRKKLANYYTKPGAAALMAHLAIPEDLDWSQEGTAKFRAADYSCGTGALLMAACRRIHDLHRQQGGDSRSARSVHQKLLQCGLSGADILPANVAIAAANLAAMERGNTPEIRVVRMHYGPMGDGGEQDPRPVGLGALDILDKPALRRQERMPQAHPRAAARKNRLGWRQANLIMMNPPYTKTSEHRAADQNIPNEEMGIRPTSDEEIQEMDRRMRGIGEITKGFPSSSGMAYFFSVLAQTKVKPGGTIALILPMAALAGSNGVRSPLKGWPRFRRKLREEFNGIKIVSVTAYNNQTATFSEDTSTSEVMVIARRIAKGEIPERTAHFINLHRTPGSPQEAAVDAASVQEAVARSERLGQKIRIEGPEGTELGVVVRAQLPETEIWTMARTMDPTLIYSVEALREGILRVPEELTGFQIPMTTLGNLAVIGPTGYEVRQVLAPNEAAGGEETCYVLDGHDAEKQKTMVTGAGRVMAALPGKEKIARRLNETETGRLHVTDTFRFTSQATAACLTSERSIGGRGWPTVTTGNPQHEKAIALWLNTTPGIIGYWGISNHTQGGLGYASRKQMERLPVLDPRALTGEQLASMERVFERWADRPMLPACDAWKDQERIELDRQVLVEVLKLSSPALQAVEILRNKFCEEPTVLDLKAHRAGTAEKMPELRALNEG